MDGPTWHERREHLEKLGGAPDGIVLDRPDRADVAQRKALLGHWREAGRCAQQGKWSDAVEHLDFLIKAEPSRSMHFLDRARAYAHLDRWDDAAAEFAKAIRLGSDDQWVADIADSFFDRLKSAQADKPHGDIVAFWVKLAAEFPERLVYQVSLSRARLEFADLLNQTSIHREAAQQWRQTIAHIDRWMRDKDHVVSEELIGLRTEADALLRQGEDER